MWWPLTKTSLGRRSARIMSPFLISILPLRVLRGSHADKPSNQSPNPESLRVEVLEVSQPASNRDHDPTSVRSNKRSLRFQERNSQVSTDQSHRFCVRDRSSQGRGCRDWEVDRTTTQSTTWSNLLRWAKVCLLLKRSCRRRLNHPEECNTSTTTLSEWCHPTRNWWCSALLRTPSSNPTSPASASKRAISPLPEKAIDNPARDNHSKSYG